MNYREIAYKLEAARKAANKVIAQVGHNGLDTNLAWELMELIVELRDTCAKKAKIDRF